MTDGTVLQPLKHVNRLLQIERHHLRAAGSDLGLGGYSRSVFRGPA
ncbi:MAG TPA: hypothetical protein VFN94_03385 [Nitrospiria bacterium]|nr:hypothetical protein [Nitrospiria bacterium]